MSSGMESSLSRKDSSSLVTRGIISARAVKPSESSASNMSISFSMSIDIIMGYQYFISYLQVLLGVFLCLIEESALYQMANFLIYAKA